MRSYSDADEAQYIIDRDKRFNEIAITVKKHIAKNPNASSYILYAREYHKWYNEFMGNSRPRRPKTVSEVKSVDVDSDMMDSDMIDSNADGCAKGQKRDVAIRDNLGTQGWPRSEVREEQEMKEPGAKRRRLFHGGF